MEEPTLTGQVPAAQVPVHPPPERPLLIWDGECGFCRRWVRRWERLTLGLVDYATSQAVGDRYPQLHEKDLSRSVYLIDVDGRIHAGAEAVFRSLARAPHWRWMYWLYRKVPLAAPASELVYALVARNRYLFSRVERGLFGDEDDPTSQFTLATEVFLRLLGLIYLAAFVSFAVQAEGLVGPKGILPLGDYLGAVKGRFGDSAWKVVPSVFWWGHGETALAVVGSAGALAGAALALGVFPAGMLLVAWFLYLSVQSAGQIFLGYQWDILLLEVGFLAIWLAPLRAVPRPVSLSRPSPWVHWMFRWLLFRLMLSSGIVKLASGDEAWSSLTALTYHYETQPIPNWVAWYAHQLPLWFHKLSALATFAIELVVPFLILGPRRPRLMAAALTGLLQSLILLTGNYGFFNLLTLALCILLVDDGLWPGFVRRAFEGRRPAGGRWPWVLSLPVALALLALSWVPFSRTLGWSAAVPSSLASFSRSLSPLRLTSSYGLFAVMTRDRPEILVEGSSDGKEWKAYEFRYKPGDLERRPPVLGPHMPRLDWQMWFAALGDIRRNPWFVNFCIRLLTGQPEVLALLKTNPFPDEPPRYIRARVWDYHFATEGEGGGRAWWRREERGAYGPVLSLPGNR